MKQRKFDHDWKKNEVEEGKRNKMVLESEKGRNEKSEY